MDRYTERDTLSFVDAKAEAQRIAFAPVVFQAARALRDLGILRALADTRNRGATLGDLVPDLGLSAYGVEVLLDMGLSAGLCWMDEDRYVLTKTGFCVLSDRMTNVNMDFIQDVCYQGLFTLDEAIREGRPAGLEVFGKWPTIYEALSELPEPVQKSWFAFDHYYSDHAFPQVLPLIFEDPPKHLLDVGGNTGRWALHCVQYDPNVQVTILDLPGQLREALAAVQELGFAERVHGHPINLLDADAAFPAGADAIWMSQFLDCFSTEQIAHILGCAKAVMTADSALYILETYWDRQRYEAGAFSLNATSLYFTAMANGNSRMYHSRDMIRMVHQAGMYIERDLDDLGVGHTLFVCRLRP